MGNYTFTHKYNCKSPFHLISFWKNVLNTSYTHHFISFRIKSFIKSHHFFSTMENILLDFKYCEYIILVFSFFVLTPILFLPILLKGVCLLFSASLRFCKFNAFSEHKRFLYLGFLFQIQLFIAIHTLTTEHDKFSFEIQII